MKHTFDTLAIVLCVVFGMLTLSSQYANSQTIQKKYSERVESIKPANNSTTPLPAGTYTVGKGGNYTTLSDAFDSLSINGITGPVTLSLIDTLYDATTNLMGWFGLTGPISGAGPNSRITIRPAENVAVTIIGNGEAVLLFNNVSYLTLDGVNLLGNTRLKVRCLSESGFYADPIMLRGNCDFDVIQHLTVSSNNLYWGNGISLISDTGGPDSCLVSGVSVTSGGFGIYLAVDPSTVSTGNVIRGNYIGSPTDSLICVGITDERTNGTIIENNIIENLRLSTPDPNQIGILAIATRNTIIRNNTVHNICNTKDNSDIQGILVAGRSTSVRGVNVWIYNNKVWDIKNRAALGANISGIRSYWVDSLKVDYNTVYLSECGDVPPTGWSSALRFSSSTYLTVRNNILVNTRDDSLTRSTAIVIPSGEFLSDYNDLHVGSGDYAYVGLKSSSNYYKTLENWKTTGQDIHSVSVLPSFLSDNDLHIDTLGNRSQWTPLANKGIAIAGCECDCDNDNRIIENVPDIGADEFWINLKSPTGTGVANDKADVPQKFSLLQNYPNPFNPTTSIIFSITKSAIIKLSIYDLLGREVTVLVNEERPAGRYSATWDASRFASGVYFYRLETGTYTATKKMALLR